MIDKRIEVIINNAFRQADRARYEFFTSEHMLLALVESDPYTTEILLDMNIDLEELCKNLDACINRLCPKITTDESIIPTESFNRIVERAVSQRKASGKDTVYGVHLIISLLDEPDTHACYYLQKQGLERTELIRYVTENSDIIEDDDDDEEETSIFQYCTNLNELAKKDKIDTLIGRNAEVERMIQILSRRRKNNPLLIGDAGVGKTAIIEGLAKKIVDNQVPELLKDIEIYAVDLGSMVAGSKYRGDFEKKVKDLVNYFKNMPNSIIFIDEIHTLLGAGATSESTLDASNLLKPALSSGELRCIGATTYQEYKASFEKNVALSRRFQKIEISEPSIEEATAILNGLSGYFETFHQVKFSKKALSAAVELTDRFIHDRFLPDKAIDVIDEAGAKAKLAIPKVKHINELDIEKIVASMAKVPVKTISIHEKNKIKLLEKHLSNKVFGQQNGILALVNAIKLSKAGLSDINKPIGSFLFTGPTGVGKTEVAKQLATELGIDFIRFDMSEYMESHSVSRLIGSPPGYVGFDKGGLLTEAINKSPHAVLLLDEIEKAHSDILNLLLQIMDYGKLTDSYGKTVHFANVILIMTSNVGASNLEKNQIGFTKNSENSFVPDEHVKRIFSPEFRNRLTKTIAFQPLDRNSILLVISKQIQLINDKLVAKQINITLSKPVEEHLLDKGYNKTMGARPMQRLIEDLIMQPLVDEILFGKLMKGGKVKVSMLNNKIKFDIEKASKPALKKLINA